MVTDLETGKPRGFAFVEFENAQDALSAIRNMNEYELNGRKIRVNFSNSSHLETLAGQLGMDMTQKTKTIPPIGSTTTTTTTTTTTSSTSHATGPASSNEIGTQAVANALKSMSKGEMYDVIAKLKEIADSDPDEARKIISGHPQLPEAILYLMSQLDMMKTGINTNVLGVTTTSAGAVPPPIVPGIPPPVPHRVDPRTAAASGLPPPPVPSDPRDPRTNRASDPRAASDPRRQQQQPPPPVPPPAGVPPPPPQQMYMPGMAQPSPVGVPPPPPMGAIAGLDPALVQQVMGLTAAQIAQLPVDKQNSILALRQQIQNATGRTGA